MQLVPHKEFACLLPESYGFSGSWWWVFTEHLAQSVSRSALVIFLLSPHLMHLSPDWKWSWGWGLESSYWAGRRQYYVCQVEWIASVFRGAEEFWTHSPMSHKRALGGGRGERAVLGHSWYCFRKFICVDITCDYPEVSQKHQNIWMLVLI